MGGRTYHEIIGFGVPWPYKDKQAYVISRYNTNVIPNEKVEFITENIYREIAALKALEGKDIPNKPQESKWKLADSKSFSTGLVLLTYKKK